ncbi:hypothetical protein Pla52o_06670 [Novipirellula galeiformis]|uniref:Uncharacterized protein n=1 Tax=Novipirellula galeiformis TaxID=2528004 RepID=A0A5C6CQL0_9BACT|nr:hypothetical protein Pla52o_06670 [Novipirellula galeiformis]
MSLPGLINLAAKAQGNLTTEFPSRIATVLDSSAELRFEPADVKTLTRRSRVVSAISLELGGRCWPRCRATRG